MSQKKKCSFRTLEAKILLDRVNPAVGDSNTYMSFSASSGNMFTPLESPSKRPYRSHGILRADIVLRPCPDQKNRGYLSRRRIITIKSTIGRMFSSPAEQSQFMGRLRFIWDPSELKEVLQEQHKTKTRELLLLDHFNKHRFNLRFNFLDNGDRYIGCSKPACYPCYFYTTHDPGRYAVPPSIPSKAVRGMAASIEYSRHLC